jgi:hypothetical protein
MKKKKKLSQEKKTLWESIRGGLTKFYNSILKPFLGGLLLLTKILVVLTLFGFYLFLFSQLVLEGIGEASAIYLAIGVGGYIVVGLGAFFLTHHLLIANKTNDSQKTLIVKEYSPLLLWEFRLTRDLNNLSERIYSLKYDLKFSKLDWKIDDVLREIKDLKRSLEE